MLKWTVNNKKGESQAPSRLSLDTISQRPIVGPTRRRSLGGPSMNRRSRPKHRRSCHDKENRRSENFAGCTPAFAHKELMVFQKSDFSSKVLKDVSNMTPKSPTPSSPKVKSNTPDFGKENIFKAINTKLNQLDSRLYATPTSCMPRSKMCNQKTFLKKRRILLDKDIYKDSDGEHADEENEAVEVDNSSQKEVVKNVDDGEGEGNDAVKKGETNSDRVVVEKPLWKSGAGKSVIHTASVPTFEIEYSPGVNASRNFAKTSKENDSSMCLSTLPVIGSRIFIKNPLYFNMDDLQIDHDDQASKIPKNDFVDNFTSILNKLSPMSALRHHGLKERSKICSEVSPLAKKLASLCFNKAHQDILSPEDEQNPCRASVTPVRVKKRRPIFGARDDEVSIELETKMISEKSVSTIQDSTDSVTDSKMGDITLEKMIEDILKSTKKVKHARRIKLRTSNININKECVINEDKAPEVAEIVVSYEKIDNLVNVKTLDEEINIVERVKEVVKVEKFKYDDVFSNVERYLEKDKTFIVYDPLNSSEREVKTPEHRLRSSIAGPETMLKGFLEKSTLASVTKSNRRKRSCSLDCTPTHNGSNNDFDFNLKRQRCVRRKRTCNKEDFEAVSLDGHLLKESSLTLKTGIPSPFTPDNTKPPSYLYSNSYDSITGYPFTNAKILGNNYIDNSNYTTSDLGSSPTLNFLNSRENLPLGSVSNSSLMLGQYSPEKMMTSSKINKSMFGLTLECGIPSPFTTNIHSDDYNMNNQGLFTSFLNESPIQPKLDDSIDVISEPATPNVEFKSSRRCLTYSPDSEDVNSSLEKRSYLRAGSRQNILSQQHSTEGTIDLVIETKNDQITVHIIRCRNLMRPNGCNQKINAYVKVSMSGVHGYQRTPVRRDSTDPHFGHVIRLPAPSAENVFTAKLQISVWHRNSQQRRSEFLGCVSVGARHAARRPLLLLRRRLSQRGGGGGGGASMADQQPHANGQLTRDSADDKETSDSGVAAKLAAQQREADEHLFLRYLELDPVEGPDAGPAAVQRKASGNRQGRTPFTTTRRLDRGQDQGFGFSVLWTRPPRVERVDAGRAADRAGLQPGDYVVFVDRHNVVTMPERQVLTLIKSSGAQLLLETFRRSGSGVNPDPRALFAPLARGSIVSHASISTAGAPCSPRAPPAARNLARPSTACSNNTQRSDQAATSVASRRRPQLQQVAFTRESLTALGGSSALVATSGCMSAAAPEHARALHAVVTREQHYAQSLHFGVERYLTPLASRTDIMTPAEHKLLFQNCEELLRLSEDILEQLVTEEGEIQTHLVASTYLAKMPSIISLYKTYCNGLKRADCVLVQKSRQQGGGFVRLCTEPAVPRRRPDVTQLVHKPLEQFRELLRLLRAARATVPPGHQDSKPLGRLVSDLQNAYADVTAGAGLMGPLGEGRPLLSVADLESRLVFTRCKPFVLSKPGRQWIFGGDLCRVEGRTVRPFWALLFSDLLLFATVSRDRVLFITEEPLPISHISETCFNVRKRANEFRLSVGTGRAGSPTARCGQPTRTRCRTLLLRAPSPDLKAVWQSLLLRQICRVNSSNGTPLSSPMESPAPFGCYSEVTLDSQQRQVQFASSLGPRDRHGNLRIMDQQANHQEPIRHHSVSFASTGAVYDSISKLSGITLPCTSRIKEEEYRCNVSGIRSYEMLSERINEETTVNEECNVTVMEQTQYMVDEYRNLEEFRSFDVHNGTKTPDTPPPNVSPGESSKNSQTFSSHFVSMNSLEKGNSEENYSPHRRNPGYSNTPSSPSAILTPDFMLDSHRTKPDHFGEHCILETGEEVVDSDGLCRWESFEADLALVDLNLDPCFKTDVEENIYFREDFFSPRRSTDLEKRDPPSTLDL